MKKTIYLLIGFVLLIGLGYFTVQLLSKKGKSDAQTAAFNFDIKDTASVNHIIITEPNGMEIDMVRDGKVWTRSNGECIQYQLVNSMLDAAFNIRFKGYVPENAVKTVSNRMAAVGTKVQFFVDGEWHKTWFLGSSTPDHYGTYMLVESDEYGKSDLPVIMEIKGMKGIISPRFFADPRRWECTNIFGYEPNEISTITVKHTAHPDRNFEVKTMGANYKVTSNGKAIPNVNPKLISRYLLNFRRIHYELPNFELTDRQVDSVKHSTPFCLLQVKAKSGEQIKLRMFKRKSDSGELEVDDFGESSAYDINRFWCELPSGKLVKCQYFVFNPLIMGQIYFNYQPTNAASTPGN